MKQEKLLALIVDPDLTRASAWNSECTKAGVRTVVARDLGSALLMLTQHTFDMAVIASRVAEEGDGWALAGVFRMLFPSAYLAVMTPERSVLALQSAVNTGADQVVETREQPGQVLAAALRRKPGSQSSSDRVN